MCVYLFVLRVFVTGEEMWHGAWEECGCAVRCEGLRLV